MECPIENLTHALMHAYRLYEDQLLEYCNLALSPELDDAAVDRLEALYRAAENNPLLNFLMNELDYRLNHQLGLLTDESAKSFKNQQAWLREHLEQMPLDCEYRKEFQELLRDAGFYKGPIDGVLGDRSAKAIKKFVSEVQRLLHEKGFYHESIDGEFGKYSFAAVQQFQRTHDLKDDGVLGRQTFSALK